MRRAYAASPRRLLTTASVDRRLLHMQGNSLYLPHFCPPLVILLECLLGGRLRAVPSPLLLCISPIIIDDYEALKRSHLS
jgi:hypothetical protein